MANTYNIKVNKYYGTLPPAVLILSLMMLGTALLPVSLIIKIILVIFIGIFWIGPTVMVLSRSINLKRGKWALLHYPLMVKYANAQATVLAWRQRNFYKDELSGEYAIRNMVNELVSDDEDMYDKLWSAILKRNKNKHDVKIVEDYIKASDPDVIPKVLKEVIDDTMSNLLDLDHPYLLIAELVGDHYGDKERTRYINAVLNTTAR